MSTQNRLLRLDRRVRGTGSLLLAAFTLLLAPACSEGVTDAGQRYLDAQEAFGQAYCATLACSNPILEEICQEDFLEETRVDAECLNQAAEDHPSLERFLDCESALYESTTSCLDGQVCTPTEESFSCGSGETIPGDWQCDYEADCADGSDEVGCPENCFGQLENTDCEYSSGLNPEAFNAMAGCDPWYDY